MADSEIEVRHRHSLETIKSYLFENWDKPSRYYEAYVYLFSQILDDVRRDFVSGTVFYKDHLGRLRPIENDLSVFRSFAMSSGLQPSKVEPHLYRYISGLTPRWLIDVPEWDKVDRVRTLCLSTVVENLSVECFYQYVLEWGAGIFGRANDPAFQNKVLILRGPQGIGKDFFIKTLCKSLGPYFGTWTNTRDERELILLMERSLILNVPEFDNTHKNEIAMLKALITKYQATYRSPYARKAESVDLRTSFISSANVEYLLRDSTGNRRYLIFVVNKFGLMDKFDSFDSLQILAQFKDAFARGFKVSLEHEQAMKSYIESQTPQQFEDQVMDAWNAEVRAWCRLGGALTSPSDWIPAHQLAGVFDKMRKDYGIGRNHLTVLLGNRGCRLRKSSGMHYCAMQTLSVVASE